MRDHVSARERLALPTDPDRPHNWLAAAMFAIAVLQFSTYIGQRQCPPACPTAIPADPDEMSVGINLEIFP